MSFIDPIVPNPDWGNPNPTIDPDEWVDDDEQFFVGMKIQRERLVKVSLSAPRAVMTSPFRASRIC